ncbi:MAG: hypothetical protein QOJ73_7538, partial [Streptosporangiaceae bacterium]|nr:hypothetical protein [Streptosporangiaceae bacterium]
FLTQPFLTQPFLTQPFLTQPFLTQPFLTQPFLTQPFLPGRSPSRAARRRELPARRRQRGELCTPGAHFPPRRPAQMPAPVSAVSCAPYPRISHRADPPATHTPRGHRSQASAWGGRYARDQGDNGCPARPGDTIQPGRFDKNMDPVRFPGPFSAGN